MQAATDSHQHKKSRRQQAPAGSASTTTRKRPRASDEAEQQESGPSSAAGGAGRTHTLTVALPGSIVANAQSPELKTYLAGQIARAVAVFNADEVVVFYESQPTAAEVAQAQNQRFCPDPNIFLARVLQYLETPQYLRKQLIPMHPDLRLAGLLNPLDMPHHPVLGKWQEYREGAVIDRFHPRGSLLNVGLQKEALIQQKIDPGTRVTVRLESDQHNHRQKVLPASAVPPDEPRTRCGIYWGYSVRLASSLSAVFNECPYEEGYDVTIGTSERGDDAQSPNFSVPSFKHLLVVLGGVAGLESCVEGDEQITGTVDPRSLFDLYINTCQQQGSRSIRTEEALMISLSVLHPHILRNQCPP